MATQLSEAHQKLLRGKNFAHIATLGEDGAPQVTPVWIDFDGTYIIFNTEKSRAKTKNLKTDPRVSISIEPPLRRYSLILRGLPCTSSSEMGSPSCISISTRICLGNSRRYWRSSACTI